MGICRPIADISGGGLNWFDWGSDAAYWRVSMKLISFTAACGLLLSTAEAQAEPRPVPFEFQEAQIQRFPDGGCAVQLTVQNNYSQTLEIMGHAYLTDPDKVSLGEAYFHFPPALPGGRSKTDAKFYDFKLAGGKCPSKFIVRFEPTSCDETGTPMRLTDENCMPYGASYRVGSE
jgi:hypothetical protein